MVQLYPDRTSPSIPSATSLKTIVWSASGPKTLSKGYVFVVGWGVPPYVDAVVNVDKVADGNGVVSTVTILDTGPVVVVMTGDA